MAMLIDMFGFPMLIAFILAIGISIALMILSSSEKKQGIYSEKQSKILRVLRFLMVLEFILIIPIGVFALMNYQGFPISHMAGYCCRITTYSTALYLLFAIVIMVSTFVFSFLAFSYQRQFIFLLLPNVFFILAFAFSMPCLF